MKYVSAPPIPRTLVRVEKNRHPEQPDEGRKTAQLGQDDPMSNQVSDLSSDDDPVELLRLRRH